MRQFFVEGIGEWCRGGIDVVDGVEDELERGGFGADEDVVAVIGLAEEGLALGAGDHDGDGESDAEGDGEEREPGGEARLAHLLEHDE